MADVDPTANPTEDPFSSRPPCVRSCSHCQGQGHVGRPYSLASNSQPIPDAPSDALHARVVAWDHSLEIMREAEEVASHTGRAVAFEYMGKLVVVRPGDDPARAAHAWWSAFYGGDPEDDPTTE